MKERILKIGVPLFLVAVLVAAGVYPVTSSQAAAKTTYNVVVQKGSPLVSLASINDGAPAPQTGSNEGITFQLVVEGKQKTEKVKSTGGTASYYPVTIPKKSFKVPSTEYPMVGGGMARQSTILAGDAKGKLYVNGGDVDISQVLGEKKLTTKIGDGKEDPEGSLLIPMKTVSQIIMVSTGKTFMKTEMLLNFTTGKSYTIVKGSKSGLEGKAIPDNDTTGTLPKPLVGVPIDLSAETGTMVCTGGTTNIKNKTVGNIDYIMGVIWVMKITK